MDLYIKKKSLFKDELCNSILECQARYAEITYGSYCPISAENMNHYTAQNMLDPSEF